MNDAGSFDETEWALRCDLAACYRLIDLYGMSDLAGTHISARLPGPEHHFLLNPYGMLFDQITASSLIRVDANGSPVGATRPINNAGFVIHSAIHMARPDLICVLHTHTAANNAIAVQHAGLRMLTQKAIVLRDFIGYHDYEGVAEDLDERVRILNSLGSDGRIVVLRNHGALSAGRTIGEAFVWMHRFETACRFQVAALSGGVEVDELPASVVDHAAAQGRRLLGPGGAAECGRLEWPSLLAKLNAAVGTDYLQ